MGLFKRFRKSSAEAAEPSPDPRAVALGERHQHEKNAFLGGANGDTWEEEYKPW